MESARSERASLIHIYLLSDVIQRIHKKMNSSRGRNTCEHQLCVTETENRNQTAFPEGEKSLVFNHSFHTTYYPIYPSITCIKRRLQISSSFSDHLTPCLYELQGTRYNHS